MYRQLLSIYVSTFCRIALLRSSDQRSSHSGDLLVPAILCSPSLQTPALLYNKKTRRWIDRTCEANPHYFIIFLVARERVGSLCMWTIYDATRTQSTILQQY